MLGSAGTECKVRSGIFGQTFYSRRDLVLLRPFYTSWSEATSTAELPRDGDSRRDLVLLRPFYTSWSEATSTAELPRDGVGYAAISVENPLSQ